MLAVAGGKGGSGKTTTALGLGRAFARQGLAPVVVDCDPDMPDLHHYAGLDRTGGVDDVAAGVPVRRAAVTTPTVPGVRLVTAGGSDSIRPALRRLREYHGPVVVDCPPGAGPDATRPLRVADRTLLVATDREQSREDTATTGRSARALGADPVGVLLRTTDRSQPLDWPGETPILARVGTVSEPLQSTGVAATWEMLSELMLKTE